MTLLELLVKELPKRGGWPEGADYAVQDNDGSCDIKFGAGAATVSYEARGVWVNDERSSWGIDTQESYIRDLKILASDATTAIITRDEYEAALASSKNDWDGEGLPSVGKKFEFNASAGWMQAVMKYCGESFAIIVLNGSETWLKLDGVKFRPIRSEADKKRDAAIESLMQIVCGPSQASATVNKIYDAIAAGKIPGIKLED